jgi:hypothetical protein
MSALNTYTSGGFSQVNQASMPGHYLLCLPNAALAQGNWCVLHLNGVTNMVPVPIEITLESVDRQDAVRMGLSALPNASAGANGGLPFGDANGDVTLTAGTLSALATSANVSSAQTAIISAMPSTSGLAKTTDVTTAESAIIAAIPSTTGLAKTTDVTTAETAIISAMPSITGLAKTTDVTSATGTLATDVSNAQTAIISAIPSVSGLATGDELNNALSALATSAELTTAEAAIIAAIDSNGLVVSGDVTISGTFS